MLSDYFDYMATTPVHPDVHAVMSRYLLSEHFFANPDSPHQLGQTARSELALLSKRFCGLLDVPDARVIWTSGASESINLVLKGAAYQYQHAGKHIISWNTEHSATLETLRALEKQGYSVSILPVKSDGLIDINSLAAAIRRDTILISLCHVHNELGCIQPLRQISELCEKHGILLHTDCAQSIGKAPLNLHSGIHFASFSAHKFYGPKGIGALIMTDPNRIISKQIHGGKQQFNLRAGTLPLHLVAGCVCAADIAIREYDAQYRHARMLFQLFVDQLHPDIQWNGCTQSRTPYNVNICLPTHVCLARLSELKSTYALSSHSACNPKTTSHVLDAIGKTSSEQARTLRISFGRYAHELPTRKLIQAINTLVG